MNANQGQAKAGPQPGSAIAAISEIIAARRVVLGKRVLGVGLRKRQENTMQHRGLNADC